MSAISLNELLSHSGEFKLEIATNSKLIKENNQDDIAHVNKFAESYEINTHKLDNLSKSKQPLENRLVAVDRNLQTIVDDISQANGTTALHLLDELWRRAGDLQAPDEALIALQQIAMSDGAKMVSKAQFAYNDLIKYKSMLEKEKRQERDQFSVENKHELIIEDIKSKLYAYDQQSRSIAVDTLNVLRTPVALALLIQVANRELDSTIRYKALKGIWLHTADGVNIVTNFGTSTAAIDALNNAKYDQNQRIATLAHTALEDLNKQLNIEF